MRRGMVKRFVKEEGRGEDRSRKHKYEVVSEGTVKDDQLIKHGCLCLRMAKLRGKKNRFRKRALQGRIYKMSPALKTKIIRCCEEKRIRGLNRFYCSLFSFRINEKNQRQKEGGLLKRVLRRDRQTSGSGDELYKLRSRVGWTLRREVRALGEFRGFTYTDKVSVPVSRWGLECLKFRRPFHAIHKFVKADRLQVRLRLYSRVRFWFLKEWLRAKVSIVNRVQQLVTERLVLGNKIVSESVGYYEILSFFMKKRWWLTGVFQ